MRRRLRVALHAGLAAASLAACAERADQVAVDTSAAAAPRRPSCAVDARTVLDGEGIGRLRIGTRVDEIAGACDVVRDTIAPDIEGMPERTLLVALGADSVRAVIVDDRLWRLHVGTPRFRTADSLGVGTPARELARREGARLLAGEGRVFITVPTHCGLSFRIGGVKPPATLATLPADARVDEVLVVGCGG